MRDIVYNVFDIISYFVQGMLLVNLLKETQPRFPFKKYHSAAIPVSYTHMTLPTIA